MLFLHRLLLPGLTVWLGLCAPAASPGGQQGDGLLRGTVRSPDGSAVSGALVIVCAPDLTEVFARIIAGPNASWPEGVFEVGDLPADRSLWVVAVDGDANRVGAASLTLLSGRPRDVSIRVQSGLSALAQSGSTGDVSGWPEILWFLQANLQGLRQVVVEVPPEVDRPGPEQLAAGNIVAIMGRALDIELTLVMEEVYPSLKIQVMSAGRTGSVIAEGVVTGVQGNRCQAKLTGSYDLNAVVIGSRVRVIRE